MRLEVGSVAVEGLEFGGQTALDGRTLLVDRDEIRRLVLEDPHFADVDVRLARPGESLRIIHALDVAEPRWKTDGPGGVFPGFVTDPVSAGEGHTRRLAGVAVVEVGEPVPGEATHFREQVIDMTGSGAPYSPFGQTLNVVLDFRPNLAFFPPDSKAPADVLAGSAEAADYNLAITTAGLKVAARLGQTAADVTPDPSRCPSRRPAIRRCRASSASTKPSDRSSTARWHSSPRRPCCTPTSATTVLSSAGGRASAARTGIKTTRCSRS